MAVLSISMLGPLVVLRDGVPFRPFKYNKARALLAYLAVESGRAHPRAELCVLLWPELTEYAARRNLTQVLSSLRDMLADPEGQPWLITDVESVRLNEDLPLDVDVKRFDRLLSDSERHSHRSWQTCGACGDRLGRAMALYHGDFLSQISVADSAPFEEWAVLWRERLRQRAFSALERLASRAEWLEDYHAAAAYAGHMVDLDNLREASHRERMRLLALDGQWAAAEAQFEQVRRTLASELDVEPADETVNLFERVRTRSGGFHRFEPPPFRCPIPLSVLIGREADLDAVRRALRSDELRILTLTGTPGLGKTRLALEAARDLRHDFEDGVTFVDLVPVTNAAGVPAAVADALGLKELAGKTPGETVVVHLKTRQALLVLDNFEHVLGAAGWVGEVLAACPGIKVLATSRAPLRIRGEHQQSLTPLDLSEAIRLFVERARAMAPGFALTSANEPTIAEICNRLDALPLAIELVAVRTRTLSPTALLQQLQYRLPALESGPRDVHERHRTLRAAIGWSYDLLDVEAQRLFARLGVLAGGGSFEAARALIDETVSLHSLETLVEASLVRTDEVDGETRITLLETIREFAFERLREADALADAQRRHVDYFVSLAERAEGELRGSNSRAWLDRLTRDLDNLRAALTWSLDDPGDRLIRLVKALDRFWEFRGLLAEGRQWVARAIDRQQDNDLALQAKLLEVDGVLAWRQGDYPDALSRLSRALEQYKQLEDDLAVSRVLRGLGAVVEAQGDFRTSRAILEEALAIAREDGTPHAIAASVLSLGLLEAYQGNYAQAEALYAECLSLGREIGDSALLGNVLLNLGLLHENRGDFDRAWDLMQEGLGAFRSIDYKIGIGLVLLNLGNFAVDRGHLADAETFFRQSLDIQRELGDLATASYPLFGLGKIAHVEGDIPGARRSYLESLKLRYETGELRPIPRNLNGLGEIDLIEGRPERAARLFGAAEALRDRLGTPVVATYLPTYQREVATLRQALGEAEFASAWAAGRALSLDQVLQLALGEAIAQS